MPVKKLCLDLFFGSSRTPLVFEEAALGVREERNWASGCMFASGFLFGHENGILCSCFSSEMNPFQCE